MFEEKLKKELWIKIKQWRQINEEICEIESESDLPIPELFEDNVNYAGLVVQSMDLQNEIKELLIDSKYTPLTMLSRSQTTDIDYFSKFPETVSEQSIENHLEMQLLKNREEIKQRLRQVQPLGLEFAVSMRVKILYNQVITCYQNGAYDASCVLCRAIAESMIKIRCKDEYGEVYALLKKIHNPRLTGLYEAIAGKANKILHVSNEKTEAVEALKAIKLLRLFIKNFK